MDKFVTRTKSWQTLTYTSTLQKSRKDIQPLKNVVKKKPLRESQIQQPAADTSSPNLNKRRLSIRDEHLLKIFTSKPDQPLMPLNEDSGLSSSSHGSLENFNDIPNVIVDHNQALAIKMGNSCQLSDYLNSTDTARLQQKLLISQTPPVTFNEVLTENSQINSIEAIATNISTTTPNARTRINNHNTLENKEHTTPKAINHNPQMARIQRDIDSPSAAVRVRAMRALRNPTNVYTTFDVPHEEQDIISVEERKPPPPPSIEELMRDIVVYVEVRTGEDNRSEGVKKVISQLGARVNDKLLRGTTHVIFKDGLLSTYKKAKNWNIPIVSILWVEACKNKRNICDPKEFPISNIDRYENPELYEKMKRHKSMQPDSECNKRIRLKQGITTKESTPKTSAETLTKITSVVDNTPKSSRKQSDISQFFKKLANSNITPIVGDKNGSTTSITRDLTESPATQLLNRIENSTFTPIQPQPRRAASETKSTTSQQTVISSVDSKKSIQFQTPRKRTPKKKIIPLTSPKKRLLNRRTSFQMPAAPTLNTQSLQTTATVQTAGPMTRRRRSSMHSTINMSLSTLKPSTPELVPSLSLNKQTIFSAIPEENGKEFLTQSNNNDENKTVTDRQSSRSPKNSKSSKSPKRRIIRRRTTYTNQTPEISPPEKKDKTNKRRTLYTPCPFVEENSTSEMSLTMRTNINEGSKVLDENLLEMALTPTTVIEEEESMTEFPLAKKDLIEPGALIKEHSKTMVFSSTRLPSTHRRRTLFDVSMDIIQQRLHNINNSARRSVAKELAFNENSPTILPPTKTTSTNEILSTLKRPYEKTEADESQTLINTPTNINTNISSPPKTIKKRKLFIPNDDTSLILNSTPPVSAKKLNGNESSSKRRRTITSRVIEKSRKSILSSNGMSEILIKPSIDAPKSIANISKPTTSQSAPMLVNNSNTKEEEDVMVTKQNDSSSSATSLTQMKIVATSTVGGKMKVFGPTLAAKSSIIQYLNGKPRNVENEVKQVVPTTAITTTKTMLPQVNASFLSIVPSKTSGSTLKQFIPEQQYMIEVDGNLAINTPSDSTITLTSQIPQQSVTSSLTSVNVKFPVTTAMSAKSTTTIATTATSENTKTTITTAISASASNQLLTPKVVKKSQMNAIPISLKDSVAVGSAGSCSTQLQRNATDSAKKKWPYIVCTNMHREEIKVMREVCKQ